MTAHQPAVSRDVPGDGINRGEHQVTAIIPERLAQLDQLTLDHGSHETFEQGHCALELSAWMAGEPHTDHPQCVSPVLAQVFIGLNDRWDDQRRQSLKPFLPRLKCQLSGSLPLTRGVCCQGCLTDEAGA